MVSRKLLLGLSAIAITFALAACDSSMPGVPTPTTPPASPTLPPTAPAPATPSPEPQQDTTITFDTTGGIAGIHSTLTISPTGEAIYTRDGTTNKGNLHMPIYGKLLRQIDTADFFNLNDNYDSGTVSDDFYYKSPSSRVIAVKPSRWLK